MTYRQTDCSQVNEPTASPTLHSLVRGPVEKYNLNSQFLHYDMFADQE